MFEAFNQITKNRGNYGYTKNFGADPFGSKALLDKQGKSYQVENNKIVFDDGNKQTKFKLKNVDHTSLISILLEKIYEVNRFDKIVLFVSEIINTDDDLNLFERFSLAEGKYNSKKLSIMFEDFEFRINFEVMDADQYLGAWKKTTESLGEVNIVRASRVHVEPVPDQEKKLSPEQELVSDVEPKQPTPVQTSGFESGEEPVKAPETPQENPDTAGNNEFNLIKTRMVLAEVIRDLLRQEKDLPDDFLDKLQEDLEVNPNGTPVSRRELLSSLKPGYSGIVNHVVEKYLTKSFWDSVVYEATRSKVLKQDAKEFIRSLQGLLSPIPDLAASDLAHAADILEAEQAKRRATASAKKK